MINKKENDLLSRLISLTKKLSRGRFGKPDELFELTKTGKYPERIAELAESFGMMMVKVDAREFRLEEIINDLKKSRDELTRNYKKINRENISLKQSLRKKFSASNILGKNREITEMLKVVGKIADANISVLITGETGTGKEMIAKAIHYDSERCTMPFVALNCSAIPEALFESELFGIEKGVATGVEKRIGKIEKAEGGTFFLDEIGDMPKTTQVKLLRVLQERELQRVGGRQNIPLDVRIIAATSKDLKKESKNHNFRKDLYYRLNVVNIHIPPLRERKDDIPLLLNHFLDSFQKKMGKARLSFSAEALERLKEYPYPGNVRELINEVERGVALSYGNIIGINELSRDIRNFQETGDRSTKEHPLDSVIVAEKKALTQTLAEHKGNKSKAARAIGISREGLRKKLKRLGLA